MEYNQQLFYRETGYTMECTTRRILLPYHKITFNFLWHYQNFNDQDSTPFCADSCRTLAYVEFQGPLSYDDVREVVGNAIGDHLDDGERSVFIEHVMGEVRKNFPVDETPPKHTSCILDFKIWKRSFYTAESDDDDRSKGMVPAADSSLGMLDRYEVDYDHDDQGSCCCICLEEDVGRGGGAASRMPCSHVFHDGCIKEWLRTSHYCPMCRYEMPTEQQTVV